MIAATTPVQQRHLELVEEIEAKFDVTNWRAGDVDLWPPARMDLFLDLFRASGRETEKPRPGFVHRVATNLATPLTNAWKSRRDLDHWAPWPEPANAILLGDGVSLDWIGGVWRDRHGEPVMSALDRRGWTTFLMQPGGLDRLPWERRTFAANEIAVRGALAASFDGGPRADLPDHAAVLDFLSGMGVQPPSLGRARLAKRARSIAATASVFQRVLRRVRPRVAFLVTYYAGLGHAFALACRRNGLLSVDLQHCPHDGGHRAYSWRRLPARGYSTLPAVFWTWGADEAARFASTPWHAAVHGGHSQLTPFLDDQSAVARIWDAHFAAAARGAAVYEREILVALQPIGGRRGVWEALARQIEAAPASWRWWIRRHPSSSAFQDAEHQALLTLHRPNVVVEAASELPLPALLRRMSVLVSLASGAAAEAAIFGVPALFLDPEARGAFPSLFSRGGAELVDVSDLTTRIEELPARPLRPPSTPPPPRIDDTLQRLEAMAIDYRRHCEAEPLVDRSGR
jgi:hypothetical protein